MHIVSINNDDPVKSRISDGKVKKLIKQAAPDCVPLYDQSFLINKTPYFKLK